MMHLFCRTWANVTVATLFFLCFCGNYGVCFEKKHRETADATTVIIHKVVFFVNSLCCSVTMHKWRYLFVTKLSCSARVVKTAVALNN